MTVETKSVGCDDIRAIREAKKAISIILERGNREWISVEDAMPDPNVPAVIRFENRNLIFAEDDENIVYAEDESVAKLLLNIDGNPSVWSILPPHLKYNYSPLVTKDKLTEGTVVTHWSPATEDELHTWEHRLDILGDYKHLSIQVSGDYEELVYRSLLNGANLVARSCGGDLNAEGNELQAAMYATLTDLQSCIDRNIHVSRGREVKNIIPTIDDIPEALELYVELKDRYSGDPEKFSKLIKTMAVIDECPDMYQNHEEEENDDV